MSASDLQTDRDRALAIADTAIVTAALADPDNPPLTDAQMDEMRRVSPAKRIRRRLGLSQEVFAERFRIPLGTVDDWEEHRVQPDAAALAYLAVIEREPEAVLRALAGEARDAA